MHTQTTITRSVLNYMHRSGITRFEMSEQMGIAQPTLSHKLNGTRRWTLDNLDTLFDLGIITIQAYDTPYTVTED